MMSHTSRCLLRPLLLFVAIGMSSAFAGEAGKEEPFTIDDYFKLKRATELALSSDGNMVAYIIERKSLEENRTVRAVYVSEAAQGVTPVLIAGLKDARSLTWFPGRGELAFLSDRDGATQVFSYDLTSMSIRRLTDSADSVVQFRFALDGTLAYITQQKSEAVSLYEQLQTSDEGVIIDSDLLRVQHFTDPNTRDGEVTPPRRLWLAGGNVSAQVDLPGRAIDFHWSPDSARLAVIYASSEPSTSLFARHRKNLGIYNIKSRRFRAIANSRPVRHGAPRVAYDCDGWLGANKLIVRRATITDIFVSPRHPQWAVVDLSNDRPLVEKGLSWRELSLTGFDPPPLFHHFPDGRVLINKTVRGDYRSLYEVMPSGDLKRANIARDVAGNISMIRFSAAGNRAVFVHDSITEPPEIHLWRKGQGSIQLIDLNRELSERRQPIVQAVEWKSTDGTHVSGWLLLPDTPAAGSFPLITFVHGGPSVPMQVGFADYFRIWPYPFNVYAVNGMAVFFPNYRGNPTFGRAFADPDHLDGEPVDDVISGIEHLIRKGIADPKRLAISGHSHGAWLAPMVMTRYKKFEAASFAEGWGNYITVYDLASGRVNRDLFDDLYGASLYDDPKRYLRLSPVLHLKALKTAALFESGNRVLAILMMSYPKAARHAGMPTEFVIYPQTGHNPSIPRIQKESAVRNLDWFRFWLQGYENPDPDKEDQYERWRIIKYNSNYKG